MEHITYIGEVVEKLADLLISEEHTRLYLLRQDIAQLLQCHPKMKCECLAVYRMISIISRKQDCTAKFYYLMYGFT